MKVLVGQFTNKLASFKKGIQYVRRQNFENLGILIINKTVVIAFTFIFYLQFCIN